VVASPYVIDYAGRFGFPVPPSEVWAAIAQLDQFERWWSWLGELEVDGPGLQTGSVLRGTVAPPVPYRMRVAVELERCVFERSIDAQVTGDLVGDAHLRLHRAQGGTVVDAVWSIEMMQLPMRVAARVAHPLLRWGHDRVVEATVSGFRSQLLAARPGR
jgi:carbon monoxide dehydrogenase subunit G